MSIFRFSRAIVGALFAAGALSACESTPIMTGKAPETIEMKATMTAAKEIPPKGGNGEGYAIMWYSEANHSLTWKVYFTGLSGPATAAHIHGPADMSANAGVVIPLAQGAPSSPMTGSATLSAQQIDDMMAGKWYVNVHTQANPGGEIRGQVMPEAW